jgi:hypothetical protein
MDSFIGRVKPVAVLLEYVAPATVILWRVCNPNIFANTRDKLI